METHEEGEQSRGHRTAAYIMFWIFFALFVVSGVMFTVSQWRLWQEQRRFDVLAREMNLAQESGGEGKGRAAGDDSAAEDDGAAKDDRAAKETSLRKLSAANPDFIGWLRIDGTRVNYPVMLCEEAPEYYLYRDMEGNDSSSGVPFFGEGCDLASDNIIIYGHNMKNGTMFADLLRYSQEDFWREHPVISFDTMEESGEYEVIAAFQEEVHDSEETGRFKYYDYGGRLTEERFWEYVENVKWRSLYDTNKEVVSGDRLLTLSTCTYYTEDGRFVVVARRIS